MPDMSTIPEETSVVETTARHMDVANERAANANRQTRQLHVRMSDHSPFKLSCPDLYFPTRIAFNPTVFSLPGGVTYT